MRPFATVAAILTAVLTLCPAAKADSSVPEGISSFRADVIVLEDASLDVREEIKVTNATDYYKHGFRWTVPISSNDRWDLRYVPAYKPDNGIRIHILEIPKIATPSTTRKVAAIPTPR